jgi:hypothetical protein
MFKNKKRETSILGNGDNGVGRVFRMVLFYSRSGWWSANEFLCPPKLIGGPTNQHFSFPPWLVFIKACPLLLADHQPLPKEDSIYIYSLLKIPAVVGGPPMNFSSFGWCFHQPTLLFGWVSDGW